jgi:hypothetical protein
LSDNAGAEPARRLVCHSTIEDQIHLVWPSKIEVLADHVLEEQAAVNGSVEHLGQGELGLQDGKNPSLDLTIHG